MGSGFSELQNLSRSLFAEQAAQTGVTETTPPAITDKIRRFSDTLKADTPLIVPVITDAYGLFGWCSRTGSWRRPSTMAAPSDLVGSYGRCRMCCSQPSSTQCGAMRRVICSTSRPNLKMRRRSCSRQLQTILPISISVGAQITDASNSASLLTTRRSRPKSDHGSPE